MDTPTDDPTDRGGPPPPKGFRTLEQPAAAEQPAWLDDVPPPDDRDAPVISLVRRQRRRVHIGGASEHDPQTGNVAWSLRVVHRDPTRYVLVGDGTETTIPSTKCLLNSAHTLEQFVEQNLRMPTGLPAKKGWRAFVDRLLAAAVHSEVSSSETETGSLVETIADTIENMQRGQTLDDLPRGTIVELDGCLHLRLNDLKKDVVTRKGHPVPIGDIGQILRQWGWRPQEDTIVCGRRTTVWRFPVGQESAP